MNSGNGLPSFNETVYLALQVVEKSGGNTLTNVAPNSSCLKPTLIVQLVVVTFEIGTQPCYRILAWQIAIIKNNII